MNRKMINIVDESEEDDIDLDALIHAVFHRWWIVLISAIVFGVAAVMGTAIFIAPKYEATFTAYVNNTKSSSGSESLSSQDITASRDLTSTYAAIITSQPNIENAIAGSGLDVTYKNISKGISVSTVSDTEIIRVSVITKDPQTSFQLAQALEQVSPEYVSGIVEGSSMVVISPATVPEERYSPSYKKALIIGAIFGFALMCALLVIMELMDNRVKDASELEKYGIVVIGNIHDLSAKNQKKGYYGYYGYGKRGKN